MSVVALIRRLIAAAVTVVLLACGLAACTPPKPSRLLAAIEAGTVTVGTKFDPPGLSLRDPDGAMRGFDVDVAAWGIGHIAARNGLPRPRIEWVETASGQREIALKEHRVDMVAATYSITPSARPLSPSPAPTWSPAPRFYSAQVRGPAMALRTRFAWSRDRRRPRTPARSSPRQA
ncbi:transporter substrate-binding domain-containing protein [Corynebacterium atypicum]|uniref:transporter substrate-binding domain-containing protein n=1 Tax=Corynebacterium atypicum TaxID=191610 RepID=UPI00068EA7A4